MSENLYCKARGDERTAIARRYTDSAESWLRKLVHDELIDRSNPDYITAGQWKKELKDYVAAKYQKNPGKYMREIDATTFDQLITIVCHPDHWSKWSAVLLEAYPDGPKEARTFLDRLQAIRNDVSHGQVCSARQLEQAICYTNDLADSIKSHYRSKGMGRDFPVPTFLKCYDNLGNLEHLKLGDYFRFSDFSGTVRGNIYLGAVLVAEVEVDPSFDPSTYDVVWWVKTSGDRGSGTTATIPIEDRHVGERMELQFKLTTKARWHRSSSGDDVLDLYYRVLPPL